MPIDIIVVDDEPALADTLAMIFQRAGYNSSVAYSGEQALAIVSVRPPALAVVDVVMPGMNGLVLAEAIRGLLPSCRVLLFSGNADTESLLEAARREGHVYEVLAKPVPPVQLLAKVASMLGENACACGR